MKVTLHTIHGLLLRFVSNLSRRSKQTFIVALDVLLVPVGLLITFGLSQNIVSGGLWENWMAIVLLMTISGLLCSALGIHKVQLKAYETRAFGMTVMHSLVVGAAAIVLDQASRSGTPISVPIIFAFVYLGICAGSRFILLQVLHWVYRSDETQIRVLIYGAGRTGKQLAAALKTDETILPIAFVEGVAGQLFQDQALTQAHSARTAAPADRLLRRPRRSRPAGAVPASGLPPDQRHGQHGGRRRPAGG